MNSTKPRLEAIDIIRGVALLGVLIANMRFFNTSSLAIALHIDPWTSTADRVVKKAVELLVAGKFISIFSFLFGFGVVMMRDNALAQGLPFKGSLTRRLLALMAFGLLHGLLIWYGDILFHYALLGLLLIPLAGRKPKTLLVCSMILVALVPCLLLLTNSPGPFPVTPELETIITNHSYLYGEAPYSLLAMQRVNDWVGSFFNQLTFYPHLLGMFLLGSYFAKRRLLHDIPGNRAVLRRLCVWIGGAFAILSALTFLPVQKWADLAMIASWPLGAVFSLTALALLLQTKRGQIWLRPFGSVGRMAFTNYILQSVIGTLIFYSYGLGLHGQVGHATGLLLSLGIFAVQMLLSRLWLQRFRMGPLERIWRALTYGKHHRSPLTAEPRGTSA
ncbi:DUF418 domain-containing protein [Paenibacillus filicis]|uniref:DUF418 domain-containing protein n=1 Tax=Paenibacillus filicis TaxID=669464 RepID=A0ABU9DG84_9BACL